MIAATKANVDEARATLVEHIGELDRAVFSWRMTPTSDTKLRDVRDAIDEAGRAFDEYEAVLKTWAAGPNGAGQ